MTAETITFDRIKDDPCYGCKYAILKSVDNCGLFESLYLCKNRKRLDKTINDLKHFSSEIDLKNHSLKTISTYLSSIMSTCGKALAMTHSSDTMNDLFLADPDNSNNIVCFFKESEDKSEK